MSGLIPYKVLSIFLQNPAYKNYGFRIWFRILKKYDPRGKDALFDSASTLYTLEQSHDDPISAYMSQSRFPFSRIHGIMFNTIANLFIIVNSYCSRFGALFNQFHSGDPEVFNADVDCLETLLETIESRS